MHSRAIFLGFDPGGKNAFGVALLVGNNAAFSTVTCVDAAIEWTRDAVKAHAIPTAAGIDTLLHWSCSPGGNRHAEDVLRARYPDASPTIISPNSLYGSMAIGGMALGYRLRALFPNLPLNETHPKLLARHFCGTLPKAAKSRTEVRRAWMTSELPGCNISAANDHEVDAIISAWATRTALSVNRTPNRAWRDLVAETSGSISPLTGVHYYWPT